MSQLRPREIIQELGISPATLRLWSINFAPVLSPSAQRSISPNGTSTQRRYTPQDLAYFKRAQELLKTSHTYEEVLTRLQNEPTPIEAELPTAPQLQDETRLATSETHPVMLAFQEALAAKDETIRVLQAQIEDFRRLAESPAPEPLKPVFRWRFFNWLLKP